MYSPKEDDWDRAPITLPRLILGTLLYMYVHAVFVCRCQMHTLHVTCVHVSPPGIILPPPPCSSGTLQRGDLVLSINGVSTDPLTHQEVTSLLQNARNFINLEIAYESPPGGEGGWSLEGVGSAIWHIFNPEGLKKNEPVSLLRAEVYMYICSSLHFGTLLKILFVWC